MNKGNDRWRRRLNSLLGRAPETVRHRDTAWGTIITSPAKDRVGFVATSDGEPFAKAFGRTRGHAIRELVRALESQGGAL